MAHLAIGDAIGEGPRLIRRRPLAVLAWGLATGVFLLASVALFAPVFQLMAARANAGAAGHWAPDLATMMRLQSTGAVLNIGGLFLRAVIIAAVFRAVLTPEDHAFAYMRIGIVEVFLVVLLIGAALAVTLIFLCVGAPFVLVVVWLAVAHNVIGAVFAGILGALIALIVAVWVAARLSLLGPMILATGEFPLGEAWALSRGKAGGLVLMAVAIAVILLALEIVVFGVLGALGVGVLTGLPHGVEGLHAFFSRSLTDLAAGLAPILALCWLVVSLFAGVASAIVCAPWAGAYRQLAGAPVPAHAAAPLAGPVV